MIASRHHLCSLSRLGSPSRSRRPQTRRRAGASYRRSSTVLSRMIWSKISITTPESTMKHDMQEPFPVPLLTRRMSLLTLAMVPSAFGTGMMSRIALSNDHEQLGFIHEIRPETWTELYRSSLDINGTFRMAYSNPSRENTRTVASLMTRTENPAINSEEEDTLNQLIDNLFESGNRSLEDIRASISRIVGDISTGVNRVTDAVGVIALGALDADEELYDDLNEIRESVARRVIAAMEGVVTMGSLLTISGKAPIRHPLILVVGAFLFAASAVDESSNCGN